LVHKAMPGRIPETNLQGTISWKDASQKKISFQITCPFISQATLEKALDWVTKDS
jgi:hypothetical protein